MREFEAVTTILDLECNGCHGMTVSEQTTSQPYLVSVWMNYGEEEFNDMVDGVADGREVDYPCYAEAAALCKAYVHETKCYLIENLARDLCMLINSYFSLEETTVKVSKPQVAHKLGARSIEASVRLNRVDVEGCQRPDLWLWKKQFKETYAAN